MKHSVIWLFLATLLAVPALAEEHGAGGKRGDRFARMQKHLQLSDDQVAEMRSIRENGGTREDVHAVLTDDQRAQ